MSTEKLLHRIETAPSTEPGDDLRQLRHDFVRCSGRMGSGEIGQFVNIAEQLLAQAPLIERIAFARPLSISHIAPRQVVMQLAYDHHMVSAAILERSPLLDDEQLATIVKVKGRPVKLAVAKRPTLPVNLTDLLMEEADLPVCRALAANSTARISRKTFVRLLEVAKSDDLTRAVLSLRRDLPKGLAAQLDAIDPGTSDYRLSPIMPHDTGFGLGRAGFVITRRFGSAQHAQIRRPKVLSYS